MDELTEQHILRIMSRSLRSLWTDDLLAFEDLRFACYRRADIREPNISRFDAAALELECIRRVLMAREKQRKAA